MFPLASIQAALSAERLDGWLLYHFCGLNVLARRVLGFPEDIHATRRWFYLIPTSGQPRKLVHRIEPRALDAYDGEQQTYLRWQELQQRVRDLVVGCKRVAMEYSPGNVNPYVSRVDAGTVELVRSCGVEIVSSGDLIQLFEACWDDEQWQMHLDAAEHTESAFGAAWAFIADRTRAGQKVHETEVQNIITAHLTERGLVSDPPPIVGVNAHSADPHYAPAPGNDGQIGPGDFVLIDLWAQLDRPRAVYSDLTWTGFVGTEVPQKYEAVFQVVAKARDAAIATVHRAFARSKTPSL